MKTPETISGLHIELQGPITLKDMGNLQAHVSEFEGLKEIGDQIKHAYACYGLAIYYSQVFEQGLINLLYLIEGLSRRGTLILGKRPLDVLEKRTLGQLLRVVSDRVSVGQTADKLLRFALRMRNSFSHGYFLRRVEWMQYSRSLRFLVIDCLRAATLFRYADFTFSPIAQFLLDSAGITRSDLDALSLELQNRARRQYCDQN